MKIGILTLMHGFNYGGMLQCHALSRALSAMGHQVEVLDYHPNPRWRAVQSVLSLLPATIANGIENKIERHKYGAPLADTFGRFRREKLPLSGRLTNHARLCAVANERDALIVGSDQVWNLNWFTKEYFLDLGSERRFRKVSYAACFGSRSATQEMDAAIGPLIADFDRLSVRNVFSQNRVIRLCGRRAEIVGDPTILEDQTDLESEVSLSDSRFALLYVMSKERLSRHAALIDRKKRAAGLKLVAVRSDVLQPWPIDVADVIIENPTVGQWLWLVRKAALVITDSFHGTLFAARAGVPFVNVLGGADSAIRLEDAAERYELGGKSEDGVLEGPGPRTGELFTAHAEASRRFLREALH